MVDNLELVLSRLDAIDRRQKTMETILTDLQRMQRFRPDDRQEMLIAALEENGGSLCWTDLKKKFPKLKCQYSYHEQFVRDIDRIAPFLGLINTNVGKKSVYHRPDVDPMAGKSSAFDLGSHRPNDPQLLDHLVKHIKNEGPANIKWYLDDHAPDKNDDWKDKVMDALVNQPTMERGKTKDRWAGKDGKAIPFIGPDWFRAKVL